MRISSRLQLCDTALLSLLLFSVLWKGGKSLEATWLLLGMACVCLLFWRVHVRRKRHAEARSTHHVHPISAVPPLLLFGLLFFVAWTVVSYGFSQTATYGLDAVFRTAGYALLCAAVLRFAQAEDAPLRTWIPRTLAIGAVLSFLIGSAVYVLQPVDRFVGTFFDARFHTDYWPNAWAEFVLLAWPMILLELLLSRRKWSKALWLAVLGLVLGGLLLSYSRGGILAFGGQIVLGIVLTLALWVRDVRYREGMRRRIVTTAGVASLVGILAVSVFLGLNAVRATRFPVQSVQEKVTFTAAEGNSSVSERSSFWKQSWELSFDHPWTGYGPGSFRFVQTARMDAVLATSDHPHNYFLQILMERGLPALVALLFILVWVGIGSLRRLFLQRRSQTPLHDIRTVLWLVAVAGVLAHVQIDYNLQFTAVGLGMWLVLGLLAIPASARASESEQSFARWRLRTALTLAECGMAAVLLCIAVSEGYFLVTSSVARHAEAVGNTDMALEWYARSSSELFSRDALLSRANLLAEKGEYAPAIDLLEQSIALNPHDARAWLLLGDIKIRQKEWQQASAYLEKSFALGKYTGSVYLRQYLYALRMSGNKEELLRRKDEFTELFDRYTAAVHVNAHFIALSSVPEELVIVADQLSAAYPAVEDYRLAAQEALQHAQKEREKFTARKAGILW